MNLYRLSDPLAQNVAVSGGKGASLARLAQNGFVVPHSVILSISDSKQLALNNELRAFVDAAPQTLFAVRSSATDEDGTHHSFAGQHDTFLNVPADQVFDVVKQVVQSFTSDRALAYRQEHKLSGPKGGAVVVQKMIEADYSGVMFSLDPRHGQTEFAVIEYVQGLGDKLVSGEVTPTRATVRMSTLEVREDEPGGLSVSTLKQLGSIASRCAALWNAPVDIEFAVTGEQVILLQCRPITAFVSDTRPLYELSYTRSMTIMQQAAWHKVYSTSCKEFFGWEYPFPTPPTFFHLNNRAVEVWELAPALNWFAKKVLETNTQNPNFFTKVKTEFAAGYEIVRRVSQANGVTDREQFSNFLNETYRFSLNFAFLYYSSINDSTPEPIRSLAVAWREQDHSWADLSEALEKSIRAVFPDVGGCEIAVIPEDLDDAPSVDELQSRLKSFVYIPGVYRSVESLDGSDYVKERFRLSYPGPILRFCSKTNSAAKPSLVRSYGGKCALCVTRPIWRNLNPEKCLCLR